MGSSYYFKLKFKAALGVFDLDGNGIFENEEITDGLKEALTKVASDVGRNFSFISGLIKAFVLTIIILFMRFLVLTTIKLSKKHLLKKQL